MSNRTRQVHIEGLPELRQMSERIAPRTANRLARATVHWIAGQVRNAMRQRSPKDDGILRRAINSVRRRGTPTEAVSDVRVSHGAGVKHDAWYWHFIEFGTVKQPAQPYIQPTIDEMTPKIPAMYREHFGKRLERELEKEARKLGVNRR